MFLSNVKSFLLNRFAHRVAFVRERFSSEGIFGLYFTIGLILLLGAAWLFGGIAEDLITGDPLIQVDQIISDWLRTQSSDRFTAAMMLATDLASIPAIAGLASAACVYFLWKHEHHRLATVLLAVFGGMLLNVLLKSLFTRSRPGWADPIMALTGYSFPSGHTMMATITYGLIASFAIWETRSWWWRFCIASAAMLAITLVALSRMYLGAHYLSDVLAAFAAGGAWLALCIISIEAVRRHRLDKLGG